MRVEIKQRFMLSLLARKVTLPEQEHVFHPERQWRFDMAWAEAMLAVEIEGGVFSAYNGQRSRHTEGAGYAEDCEKYNAAAELGWTVLRMTDRQVDSGDGAALVERMLITRLGEAGAHAKRTPATTEAPRRPRPRKGAERFGHATAVEVARWRKG